MNVVVLWVTCPVAVGAARPLVWYVWSRRRAIHAASKTLHITLHTHPANGRLLLRSKTQGLYFITTKPYIYDSAPGGSITSTCVHPNMAGPNMVQ